MEATHPSLPTPKQQEWLETQAFKAEIPCIAKAFK